MSFQNGRRYHSSPASYYDEIRAASDDLCREHHLSVITPQGHGKPYAEWKAEKEGKPTVRSMIRADIDSVINDAYNFETFLLLLEKRGYEIKHSPKRKYTTVKPPGAKRAIRLDSLGYGYTEAEIKEKTKVNRQKQSVSVEIGQVKQKKYYRIGRGDRYRPKKKLTGFLALYFRYVYLLRRSKSKPMTSYRIKKEVTKLERYQKQFCYLLKNDIHSTKQLEETMKALEWEILQAEQNRKPLYRKQRTAEDGDEKQALLGEISQYTSVLREKRRELALCRRIYRTIPQELQAEHTEKKAESRSLSENSLDGRGNGATAFMKEEENTEYEKKPSVKGRLAALKAASENIPVSEAPSLSEKITEKLIEPTR